MKWWQIRIELKTLISKQPKTQNLEKQREMIVRNGYLKVGVSFLHLDTEDEVDKMCLCI